MEKLIVMEKVAQLDQDPLGDHSNKVREAICKAYHGIIRGISDAKSGFKVGLALLDFSEQERKRR